MQFRRWIAMAILAAMTLAEVGCGGTAQPKLQNQPPAAAQATRKSPGKQSAKPGSTIGY